jgi:hypothetical protein
MNISFVKNRLTSCVVDKKLIADIEKLIIDEAKEYLSSIEVKGEKIGLDSPVEDLFHISMQTKTDSLRYSSINEYKEDFLPDNLQVLIMDFNSYKDAFLNIRVIFHSTFSERPLVEISMHGPKLQAEGARIAGGIKMLVNRNKTTNHWFHNRILLLSLLFTYALWNVVNYFLINFTGSTGPMVVYNNLLYNLLFALLTIWIIISIFVRPYVTFRTMKQNIIAVGYNVFSFLYLLIVLVLFYNNFHK